MWRVKFAILLIALAAPLAAEEITLPFDSAYPPLSYRGENGHADGFDIAVARALVEKLGAEALFEAADFLDIQSGDWPDSWGFAVASMSQTEQRRERFDMVGPYYYDYIVLIGRETDGVLPSPGKGARIGVCAGCVYRAFLEGNYKTHEGQEGQPRYPGTEIVEFATDSDMLRTMVQEGDGGIDYGVTSARFAEYFRDLGFGITLSSDTVFITAVYIAVPKQGGVDVEKVREAFDSLEEAEIVSTLSRQYLGNDYTNDSIFTPVDK